MLTTLSITSLNQGKIAPRFDLEPKSAEEAAEEAACRNELAPWQAGQTAASFWMVLSARVGLRNAGRRSPAQQVVVVRN